MDVPVCQEGRKLRFEHGDRARLIVASCLTVVALPFLLREGRDQRNDRPPTVAAVAPGAEALATPSGDAVADTPAAATPAASSTTEPGPSFLSGPIATVVARTITVVVPTTSSATSETGRASYRRWPAGATTINAPCAAWFLPVGTHVTVTNLDNGHAVTCVIADRTGVPDGQLVVLDTPVFEQLADLVESPIPVTISWR